MTVAAAFARTVARCPDRPFLAVLPETAHTYGIESGELTYGDAAAAIRRLRMQYEVAGYRASHRVGLMLENRPAFFLHWLALNALGVAVVPLNPEQRPAELEYLVQHSGIVLAVAAAPHVAGLRSVAGDLPVISDDTPPPPATRRAGSDLPGCDTECALLYTSGTTGRPKGCVLSNDYYLRTGEWYAGIGGLCALQQGDRLLTPLPLTHVNAMAFSAMAMILSGGTIIQLDRFHPRTWWASVHESGATIVHYLGVMPSMLLGLAPHPHERGHKVRFGFGAGVDRRHHASFEERCGFPLIEAWSMTETGAGGVVIVSREPRHIGTNCFGRPGPAVEVRLMDDGEMLVRAAGPDPRAGFFTEYLKDPEATRAAWEGRWFRTGDIVSADSDGYLYFRDRKKNIIRRSGENISAMEVETLLRRHAAVAEVAVAPVPDELRGEEVLACIVPSTVLADPPAVATAIVRHALEELSYFKVPGWVVFVDALPLTASQRSRGAR